jgi:hypothetical protein
MPLLEGNWTREQKYLPSAMPVSLAFSTDKV